MMKIGQLEFVGTSRRSAMLAIALSLAGCGPSARERAQAEEQNRHDAQIQADWQNVVNEARPVMAALNRFEEQARQVQNEQGPAQASNGVDDK